VAWLLWSRRLSVFINGRGEIVDRKVVTYGEAGPEPRVQVGHKLVVCEAKT